MEWMYCTVIITHAALESFSLPPWAIAKWGSQQIPHMKKICFGLQGVSQRELHNSTEWSVDWQSWRKFDWKHESCMKWLVTTRERPFLYQHSLKCLSLMSQLTVASSHHLLNERMQILETLFSSPDFLSLLILILSVYWTEVLYFLLFLSLVLIRDEELDPAARAHLEERWQRGSGICFFPPAALEEGRRSIKFTTLHLGGQYVLQLLLLLFGHWCFFFSECKSIFFVSYRFSISHHTGIRALLTGSMLLLYSTKMLVSLLTHIHYQSKV